MNKNQGFALILLISILVALGSSLSLHTLLRAKSESQTEQKQEIFTSLNFIRDALLSYASLTPELFSFKDEQGNIVSLTSPGYFPCPDGPDVNLYSDAACGSNSSYAITPNVVLAKVPFLLINRKFNINLKPKNQERYWIAVDTNYLINSTAKFDNLASSTANRLIPLNQFNPKKAAITFKEQDNLIAVIFYANEPLDFQRREVSQKDNSKSYKDFLELKIDANNKISQMIGSNDFFIPISHTLWIKTIRNRLESQKQDLCKINPTIDHWFNACHDDSRDSVAGVDESPDALCPEIDDGLGSTQFEDAFYPNNLKVDEKVDFKKQWLSTQATYSWMYGSNWRESICN